MAGVQTQLGPLIEAARIGDQDALSKLISHYRPFLRIIAEQEIGPALGRRYDGSDVAQQTCLEAADAFVGFKGRTEPELSAWLRQIMRRNVANLIRDNRAQKRDLRKEVQLPDGQDSAELCWHEPEAKGTSPSQRMVRGERALDLAAAVAKLPDEQRIAVSMRYLDGYPLAEIATELDKSTSAVAGLIHRGIKTLRGSLATFP